MSLSSVWSKAEADIKAAAAGVISGVEYVMPVQLKSDLGGWATTAEAALVHDAKRYGAAAMAVAKAGLAPIWATTKAFAAEVISDPTLATDALTGQAGAVVTELMSDAGKSLIPALETAGEETLTTLARMAVTQAKATADEIVAAAAPVIADVNAAAAGASAPTK
jgi:hypothetical protein